ncbi:MAG: TIM barrel protein [Candidatus Diapherotrites archaeon]|nr:TIM barrel protein [Candidatus Diapherotrites archaeon]
MLGLSSTYFALRNSGIYESVRKIAELGFECAELGAAHAYEKNAFETIKKIKKDFPDLQFTVHGLFPPMKERLWFNIAEGLTPKNRKIIDGLLEAGRIVEARAVAVHPGYLGKASYGKTLKSGFNETGAMEEWPKEKCLDNASGILDYALKKSDALGLDFAMENTVWESKLRPLFYSLEDFEMLFARYPDLGMLFDLGHSLFESQLDILLPEFHKKIIEMHIHFSNAKGATYKTDQHAPLPEDFDLRRLLKIKQIKKIPLVLEHGLDVSEAQIPEEKEMLEKFLRGA